MRIWHAELIPHLCTRHLVATWREALGCYNIVTSDKQGYRNHPATKEFLGAPEALHDRLTLIHDEMVRRGYHPKDVPERVEYGGAVHEWENLETQITKLKSKGCACRV